MHWITLRVRIFLILIALLLTTVVGGLISTWTTYRMETLLSAMIGREVAALEAAAGLESALVMQKGLVTYFFLDRNMNWLDELERYHQQFLKALEMARASMNPNIGTGILGSIESEYRSYINSRDQVIHLYRSGQQEAGMSLHQEVRGQFFAIYDLCEEYKAVHQSSLSQARSTARRQTQFLQGVALVGMLAVLLMGALLAYVLLKQVLEPIRELAMGSEGPSEKDRPLDEVKALSRRVTSLMADVDETQSALQVSREHLLQSEKLATVGRLAAGVAHTIRNPLTSVKMRLFSMERGLDLSPTQKEDFDVISEEIRHIDAIVRNFLEFSRPPKLKMQAVSPSDVVDAAVQLLRHRLESFGVEVDLYRQRRLPPIQGDPEQLKELLVNLMVNACEAIGERGRIMIYEEEGVTEPLGHVAVIKVRDNGPGVPDGIKEQIFQPFFSTKEEGTGLGLSIALRIVEDHGGCLNLRSREGKGTTFIITLPCKEDGAWLRS
ncbi:MAG TPA: histidine kinase [Syntrophobacteraceae bacterium]|nr:histidine kinase [Syntrophobacteraceae bacterium]